MKIKMLRPHHRYAMEKEHEVDDSQGNYLIRMGSAEKVEEVEKVEPDKKVEKVKIKRVKEKKESKTIPTAKKRKKST